MCPLIKGTCEFKSHVTGRRYEIKETGSGLTCDSKAVVYLITCAKCGIQYVGKTLTQLNQRWQTYNSDAASYIADKNCKVSCVHVTPHFWGGSGCSTENLTIQPIEKVDSAEPGSTLADTLLQRELFWIKTLRTYYPFGLNEVPQNFSHTDDTHHTEKLFTPLVTKRGCRGKGMVQNPRVSGLSLYNDLVVMKGTFGWVGRVRVLLNKQKKEVLKSLARLVHEKIGLVQNHGHHHLLQVCIEMLNTRLVKISPRAQKKTEPDLIWKLPFLNPGANLLGLSGILRQSSLTDMLQGLTVVTPTVVWQYSQPIRNKIFNYRAAIDTIENWSTEMPPCDCKHSSSPFLNADLGHVLTGDLSIVENDALRRLVKLGPKFREPPPVDYDGLVASCLDQVDALVDRWAKRELKPTSFWAAWKTALTSALSKKVKKLKRKHYAPPLPGMNDPNVKKALRLLHEKFVLIPADKAENNVVVVCKSFYLHRVVAELVGNEKSTYASIDEKETLIGDCSNKIKKRFGIEVPKEHQCFASLYWVAKMHKQKVGCRFIAASKRCVTKTLSAWITKYLKAVLAIHRAECQKLKRDTGVEHCWVVESSQPVLARIKQVNARSGCESVDSFDFKNLYTAIPHEDLKKQLSWAITEAFTYARISNGVNECWLNWRGRKVGARFSSKKTKSSVSESKLIEMVCFLIDNIYVSVGSRNFQQKVGIPMGTDCGPLLANLYLFSLEFKWIRGLWDDRGTREVRLSRRKIALGCAHCFRYIDDLLAFNNRNVLADHWREIYPFLELEKQNDDSLSTDFLDLTLSVGNGRVQKSPYDKRDAFGFEVVSFPNLESNIHLKNSHGVLIGQLLRFTDSCDRWGDFQRKSTTLINKLLQQGFYGRLLRKYTLRFFERHGNMLKNFTIGCGSVLVDRLFHSD